MVEQECHCQPLVGLELGPVASRQPLPHSPATSFPAPTESASDSKCVLTETTLHQSCVGRSSCCFPLPLPTAEGGRSASASAKSVVFVMKWVIELMSNLLLAIPRSLFWSASEPGHSTAPWSWRRAMSCGLVGSPTRRGSEVSHMINSIGCVALAQLTLSRSCG